MKEVVKLQLALLVAASLAMSGVVRAATDPASDVAIKAAFLYNVAKFTEWPALAAGAPLMLCVMGDARVAIALVETVRSQRIGGHAIEAKAIGSDTPTRSCDVLFISTSETRRTAALLDGLKSLPILTVSDGKDFARSSGVIELFVDSGRMRLTINTDAVDRSGLHLSSRLLGLAKIVRDEPAQ
jgi:hypothetical protein